MKDWRLRFRWFRCVGLGSEINSAGVTPDLLINAVTSPGFARGCLCGLVLEVLKYQRVLNMGHVDLDVSAAGNHGKCDYASLCYLHQGNLIGIAYRLMENLIIHR